MTDPLGMDIPVASISMSVSLKVPVVPDKVLLAPRILRLPPLVPNVPLLTTLPLTVSLWPSSLSVAPELMVNEAAVRLLLLSETVHDDAKITVSFDAGVVPEVHDQVEDELQFPLALLVQVAACAWLDVNKKIDSDMSNNKAKRQLKGVVSSLLATDSWVRILTAV